jgi:3-phenylpropionate/trans-cinnamate dioxygenase ferredoxin reductase component
MTILIIGGGPAGDSAAVAARLSGYRSDIILISDEAEPPYERPPLSKRYLSGGISRETLGLRPPEHYQRYSIQLVRGQRVAEVDVDRHRVRLADGREHSYDKLLIATGSRSRRLNPADHHLYLRTVEDADRLREHLMSHENLMVVGAGFIGCEVAATAVEMGIKVTVYESLDQPLARVLGQETGEYLAKVHRAHGVDLRTRTTHLPTLSKGTLVAIGSEPQTELAEAMGLKVDRGILVDEYGLTSHPDIYAAGDVARFFSPLWGTHVRVEHFQTAARHGAAVGSSMAGSLQAFAEVPWFWSDQFDLKIQYVGAGLSWNRVVVRGTFGVPPFTVGYLNGDMLVGAVGIGDSRTISVLKRLVEARVELSAAALEDTNVDLKRLLARQDV